ncbi:MAG: hypothetical protein BWK76_17775 [Desulfobulbaceae bacterium A2]|nr:MAG: hypothetical protein BWK76_17775 [Desulfobulbaceae bacterium A2]
MLNASRQMPPLRSNSRQQINGWSVALEAAGIEHDIVPAGRGWEIYVPAGQEEWAMQEINSCVGESPQTAAAAQPVATTLLPPHFPLPLLPLALLLMFHLITGVWYEGNPWFEQGAVHSVRIIEQGEWWRLVTALTLHADMGHLVSNLLTGGVLLLFLAGSCGSGGAWLLLVLGGAGGNLLNVAFRQTPHLSVGFSTAVFAMVGLLIGLRACQHEAGRRLPALLWCLAAGMGLLALLGSEGERTDLGAHLFGLLVAIPLGCIASFLGVQRWTKRTRLQLFLLLPALLLPLGCWLVALADISVK